MIKKVTLERADSLYSMEPWIPELEALLSYTRKYYEEPEPGKRASNRPQFVKENLFQTDGTGKGYFPAGLFSKVSKFLRLKGIDYEAKDHRDIKRLMPVPDFSVVEKLREGQDKALLAVAGQDGGLIVASTGFGKSFIITQICKMYPTLNIVITSPRASVVKSLYDRVRGVLPSNSVGIVTGAKNTGSRRVTVVTTKSLLKIDTSKCDLLLFDEAHGVGHNKVANDLTHFSECRKFGFTATPTGRGDNAELVMEALFGPVLVDISYDEAAKNGLVTPIEVTLVPIEDAYMPPVTQATAKKRHAYWRNTIRNRTIQAIAKTIPDEEQTLIMVETLEHAINLQKLLPDYTLVHYGKVDKKKRLPGVTNMKKYEISDKRKDYLRRQFEKGELKKVISTCTWREGVDFQQLAVLIRADGITSPISSNQIPGRLSRLSEGKNVGILIDFEDTFCAWAKKRTEQRIKTYRNTGWKITRAFGDLSQGGT
jgi:superfamily II DNA or RNA helicase